MSKGCTYRQKIKLDDARDRYMQEVPTSGFLQVVDASSATVQIILGIDRESGEAAQQALKLGGEIVDVDGFDRIFITNSSLPGEWVEIICSKSREDFSVRKGDLGVINGISDPVVIHGGNSIPTQGAPVSVGTTATPFFTADPTITEWIAQNLDASKTMYCGGPGTTTTNYAFTLAPGEKLPGQCTTPPHAVVASGTANLGFMPVYKV